MRDALADLDRSLERLGARLILRRGDVVRETIRLAREVDATVIHLSEDVSRYAKVRERRLAKACREARLELCVSPGRTAVPPGELTPAGRDRFRIFTRTGAAGARRGFVNRSKLRGGSMSAASSRELAGLEGASVHELWKANGSLAPLDYPNRSSTTPKRPAASASVVLDRRPGRLR